LQLGGVNVAVMPVGRGVEKPKLTEALVPETRVAVTNVETLAVGTTVTLLGEMERLKLNGATVRVKVTVFVSAPSVLVIVIL